MLRTAWAPVAFVTLLLPSLVHAADAREIRVGGPFEIEVHRNIPYVEGDGADDPKHQLDLFVPKGQKGFPVLLFIHGGGWSSGDRSLYQLVGRTMARNGVGTVVISYRLTPQVQHPGHIEDVARAFAWTHKHIEEYGGRRDQLFVSGQSAGGHLAALLATNERYLAAVGLSKRDIKAALPISGVYVFPETWGRHVIGTGPEAADSASPLKNVDGTEPPFLILYAQRDFPTCDRMSRDLSEALAEKGVPTSCEEIKDRDHISIMLRMMLSETDPTTQALLGFIAKHSELELKPRAAE